MRRRVFCGPTESGFWVEFSKDYPSDNAFFIKMSHNFPVYFRAEAAQHIIDWLQEHVIDSEEEKGYIDYD